MCFIREIQVLNEVACDKCVQRRHQCLKRSDGNRGCEKCHSSKLGCSLIGRKKVKKSKESPAPVPVDEPTTPKRKSTRLNREEVRLVEIIGENMEPIFSYLEETRLARQEMSEIKDEAVRIADALEDIAGMMREKWLDGSVRGTEVGSEVGSGSNVEIVDDSELKTQTTLPEGSTSSGVSEDQSEEDKTGEDDDEDDDDDDVAMADGGLPPLTSGPIGIIGDPIAGPSSSSS